MRGCKPLALSLTALRVGRHNDSRGGAALTTGTRSGYLFVPLREDVEFTLYRGWQEGNASPVLAVALADHPSPQSLRRLEHEYSLAAQLDPKQLCSCDVTCIVEGEKDDRLGDLIGCSEPPGIVIFPAAPNARLLEENFFQPRKHPLRGGFLWQDR